MARKMPKYDSACYYDNKRMGRCTAADGNAYSAMMEQCGGSAARVLQEYTYFSTELKAIFEKVAAIQEKQNRTASKQNRTASGNLFQEPRETPWGRVQDCDTIYPGVFLITTEGHGGIMVSKGIAAILSPTARKCGEKYNEYIAFEEDSQENVVFRELLDKKVWAIPDRIKDKAAFEENINKSLRQYNPDYWRVRQTGIEKAPTRRHTAPQHEER